MSSDAQALPAVLRELLDAGSLASPALQRILDDYARFHLVLVVLGGLLVVALVAATVVALRRGRRGLALVGCGVTLLVALVVAANLSNVVDPRHGLAAGLGMLGHAPRGSHRAVLDHAFVTWLRTGDGSTPPAVQAAIDARLAWQLPKAVVSVMLLLVAAPLSVAWWRSRRSWGVLVVSVPLCSLLAAMVVGNTQACVAPLAMTLLYG